MFDPQSGQHAALLDAIKSGKFQQFQFLDIDGTATGWAPGSTGGLFEMEGNSLICLGAKVNPNTFAQTSSDATVQLAIRFNRTDNPFILFSLGASTSDFGGACLTFQRFWVRVVAAGGGTKHLYMAVLKGVGLYGAYGGGGQGLNVTGGYTG